MKIKKIKGPVEKIQMRTRDPRDVQSKEMLAEWWKAETDEQLAKEVTATATYLKTAQEYRMRQLATNVRMYCGLAVYSYAGSNVSKFDRTKTLPEDRPTFNCIQSNVDTLSSHFAQSKPEPKFLTDGGDYKQRHVAQDLNQFMLGEFYQVNAYAKVMRIFRDGLVMGTGALKIYEGDNGRVCVDRVMIADLFVDENDALNGEPQQLIQLKLCDRSKVLAATRARKDGKKGAEKIVEDTPQSYPDNAPDSGQTTADQIMVVEAWRLPSGPDPEAPGYQPGRHVLATVAGVIFEEKWEKQKFPFVFFNYSDPFLGFWGQGLATQLFGTQIALNRILYTIAKAITLVGVPRIFQENSSKIVSSHHNNQVGVIVKFQGVKPSYEVAPCNAPELYAERDKLIQYAGNQCGVSTMMAQGEKPQGLTSGEAIRSFVDVNSDRFTELSNKYEQIFIDLAYQITDVAVDIAKREGKYQTIYPSKDGTKEIDLPKMTLIKDPFVIKCFTESSLPRTPAGRIATVTDQVQAGMLTLKEGRRLMRYQDLEQDERLANAGEERIFKILDGIVTTADFTPPDQFMDLNLAKELVVQYINLYRAAKLEPEKDDMLTTFFNQVNALQMAAQPPAAPPQGAATPQANPQPAPTSPLIPNAPMAQAA
jgi:hypothetical protein